ncbi:hypothetical protein M426DRAFT_321435 [Hypoxylon sp. CI-4A]|nr:hypothetical protein M426DRAFT_321435 [Hypoxylon sp. CI-4A]
MSWMDSWSRPGKSQATPAPYYLLPGGESTPYCRTCGRAISPRRTTTPHDASAPSYCSQRCRNSKPRKLDREIEAAFVRLLSGGQDAARHHVPEKRQTGKAKKGNKSVAKGDPRIIVSCDEVEKAVFGDRADPEKTFGRRKNRASRVLPGEESDADNVHDSGGASGPAGDFLGGDVDSAVGLDDNDVEEDTSSIDGDVQARMAVRSGTRVRPPQRVSLVNGSVGGEKGRAERAEETEENARRRLEGQRKALHREMVRSAARRGVVFGFAGGDGGGGDTGAAAAARKCEAVMQGKVVEPSFAKGDWGVRWRE